ncbi:MAG TPA: extracellular solute-binding protein [Solirubrobacteraceae bacterium]|nr:extracellular solute-binding protein [Solirubrobacteraceae bacterium]
MHHHRASKVAALLAVVAAMVVVGCGGDDGGGGSGGGEKTQITYLVGQQESTRLEAAARDLVDSFNEQSDTVEVNRESMPVEQIRTVIKTRLNSNKPPDVFSYDTGPGFGGVLAKAGLVEPLDGAYDKYGWSIYDWARARATYGGKTYGIPEQVEEVGIFYNKQLFDEMGVQPPETLEEFERIADQLKQRGITPLAFANKEQWPAGHQFSMMVSNLLGREGLDRILYGNGAWDSPDVVKGIDVYFRQFEDRGYFPRGVNGLDYDSGNALFYQQKAAMVPTGTWLISDIAQKAPFEVGFFPFPSIDGSRIAPPAGVGNGLFVSAKSKNKQAAYEFLDWLLSEETAKRQIETFNSIPAFPVDTSALDVTPLFRQVLTDLEDSEDAESFGYNVDVLTPANFNEVMFTGFQEVLNGSRSPEEQAQRLQAAWAEAKKAGDILQR